jgi:hypothetical protein
MEYASKAAFLKAQDLTKTNQELIDLGKEAGLTIHVYDIGYARKMKKKKKTNGIRPGKPSPKTSLGRSKKTKKVLASRFYSVPGGIPIDLSDLGSRRRAFTVSYSDKLSPEVRIKIIEYLLDTGASISL